MSATLVGRKLGAYDIRERIGQGGMAAVYLGYRADLDRVAAIKVLPPHPGLDPQFIERFKLEARTIARLQHPHILPLYDYGVEDDILYLVMAYIDCGPLTNRLRSERLSLNEIERLLRQIASALDYAHRQGIIHRDIKPDNILLDSEGHPTISDFGIAKLVSGDSSMLTATGGLVGTPAYMSPEQAVGEPNLTPAADLYSLGVVVYEMLTGQQPFKADTPMQVALKHVTDPVPNPRELVSDLPPALEQVMRRALAKAPAQRYPTAQAFADDFARAIMGEELFAARAASAPPASASTLLLNETPAPGAAAGTAVAGALPPSPPQATVTPAPVGANTTPLPGMTTGVPSVIMQPAYNPLVLLGGFALIAAVLVGLVLFIVSRGPLAGPPPTGQPTAEIAALSPTATAAPLVSPVEETFGRMSFSTNRYLGDTVTLQVQNLRPPQQGQKYVAWLKNTDTHLVLKIGDLTLDALGSGVLPPYTDPNGYMLPSLYNAAAITLEDVAMDDPEPKGAAAYSAELPLEVLTLMTSLYLESELGVARSSLRTPAYAAPMAVGERASLLESAIAEAERAAQHAGLAARATTVGGMHIHNEHAVNILEGSQTDRNNDGRGENPGFGVGLLPLLDAMDALVSETSGAANADMRFQGDLEFIRVCIQNSRVRAERVIELELEMLAATEMASVAQQIADSTTFMTQLIEGHDANLNGSIEPFEEECGLEQIEGFGLLASTLYLREGSLE